MRCHFPPCWNVAQKGSPAARLRQIFRLLRLRMSPYAYRTCKHPCAYAYAYAYAYARTCKPGFMPTLIISSPKLSSSVPLRGREDVSYTDYLAVRFETGSFREEKNLYFEKPLSKASIKKLTRKNKGQQRVSISTGFHDLIPGVV